jgi:ssDNA-binding Zn-finger/Zn-ribbon topoisomerase 1
MIPSNATISEKAHALSREMYDGGCAICGCAGFQMHEIIGKEMRKILGAMVCLVGYSEIPLCAQHHEEYEKQTLEKQIEMLQNIFCNSDRLRRAQRDQMIALKSRCLNCK